MNHRGSGPRPRPRFRGYPSRPSVASNQSQIEGIKCTLRSDKNQYGLYHTVRNSQFGDLTIPVMPALVATGYSPAWGNWGPDSDVAQQCGRLAIPNVRVDMQFTTQTELQPVSFRVMHIQLTPAGATTILGDLTRDLGGGAGLGANIAYSCRGPFGTTAGGSSANAFVRLNPRYFEVKKQYDFILGGQLAVAPGQQISTNMRDSIKNISFTVPMGNQVLGTPNDQWTAATADCYKNENLNYILIFTDNTTADLQTPSVTAVMSTIGTAKE